MFSIFLFYLQSHLSPAQHMHYTPRFTTQMRRERQTKKGPVLITRMWSSEPKRCRFPRIGWARAFLPASDPKHITQDPVIAGPSHDLTGCAVYTLSPRVFSLILIFFILLAIRQCCTRANLAITIQPFFHHLCH